MEDTIYLFISHTHADLAKVRVVRNYIESLGAEPILFYLKSLTDEDNITQLIKDEIDARIWFIYCRSLLAEESTWVQTELDYVRESGKKNRMVIDLDWDFEGMELTEDVKKRIVVNLSNIRSNSTFYIGYSHRDRDVVRRVVDVLARYNIRFLMDEDVLCVGDNNWAKTIEDCIEASRYYLLFVSNASLDSMYIKREVNRARQLGKTILPVLLTPISFEEMDDSTVAMAIRNMRYIWFDTADIDKSAVALVNSIVDMLEYRA